MYGLRQSLVGMLGVAPPSAILTAGCRNKADVETLPDFATSNVTTAIGASRSTFINPLMTSWIASYKTLHPNIRVNYRPIGSGAGIDEFRKHLTEFVASDASLSDVQLAEISPTVQP